MKCRFTGPVNSDRSRCADTPLRLFTSPARDLRRVSHQQVHVIIFTVELAQLGVEAAADLPRGGLAGGERVRVEHATPVLFREDQMDMERRKQRAGHDGTQPEMS